MQIALSGMPVPRRFINQVRELHVFAHFVVTREFLSRAQGVDSMEITITMQTEIAGDLIIRLKRSIGLPPSLRSLGIVARLQRVEDAALHLLNHRDEWAMERHDRFKRSHWWIPPAESDFDFRLCIIPQGKMQIVIGLSPYTAPHPRH